MNRFGMYFQPAWAESGLWVLLGLLTAGICLAASAFLVLRVIGCWKMFQKAGQPGWKALIPVYADYTLYGIGWKKSMFWVLLGIGIGTGLSATMLGGVSGVLTEISGIGYGIGAIFAVIGFLVSIAGSVAAMAIEIIFAVKLSRAFGHDGGFAVGLIFLPSIFFMILGFGKSQYQK